MPGPKGMGWILTPKPMASPLPRSVSGATAAASSVTGTRLSTLT